MQYVANRLQLQMKVGFLPPFKQPPYAPSLPNLRSCADVQLPQSDTFRSLRFPPAGSKKVSKWAGLNHSEEVIRRAVSKSTFKSMRRKEEASGLRIFDDEYPGRDRAWRMTRKGKAGAWEECFSTPVSKDIWNELAYDTMYKLGYVNDERW